MNNQQQFARVAVKETAGTVLFHPERHIQEYMVTLKEKTV